MVKDKTCQNGTISQHISLSLKYGGTAHEGSTKTKTEVTKEASLDVEPYRHGQPFTMQALVDFQKGGNALLKKIRKLLRAGTYVEVELIISAYEDVPEYDAFTQFGPMKSTTKQIAFDRWFYCGNDQDDPESEGLYLRPDTKYTDENRDIFILWNRDILRELASYSL